MKSGTTQYQTTKDFYMHCATWIDDTQPPSATIDLNMIPCLVDNGIGGRKIEHTYTLQIQDKNHTGAKFPVGVPASLIEVALSKGLCPIRGAINNDQRIRAEVEGQSPRIRALHEAEALSDSIP